MTKTIINAVLERDCQPHYFNDIEHAKLFIVRSHIFDYGSITADKFNELNSTNEIRDYAYIEEIMMED